MKLLPYKNETELKDIVSGALLGMSKADLRLLAEQVHEEYMDGRIDEIQAVNAMLEVVQELSNR